LSVHRRARVSYGSQVLENDLVEPDLVSQAVFGTQAIALDDGLLIVAIGVVVFVLLELEKQMRMRWRLMRVPRVPSAGEDKA